MPIRHILIPIDGSAISARALDFAIERAKVCTADVTVAFAVDRVPIEAALAAPYAYFDPTPLLDALDAEAAAILNATEQHVKAAGVKVRQVKLDGAAGSAIARYIQESNPDEIVIGTHGRSGLERAAIGSTAEEVLRSCDVPVFVVPKKCTPHAGALTHVLVAVDGSPASDAGLAFACELAKIEGARLTLCTVVESERVESAARSILESNVARATSLGLTVTSTLLHGDALERIVGLSGKVGADAVVVGTHGRAGIPRFVLGSVAEGILRTSSIPVCTIRHRR